MAVAATWSLLATGCTGSAATSTIVPWAWERSEDLRFLPGEAELAVQTGFVDIRGNTLLARGRRFPLLANHAPKTGLIHVQIDPNQPLRWSPALRDRVAAAAVHYATLRPVPRVQIDFEVPASQRAVLLDLLGAIRHRLPQRTIFSMTALASWCDGESWLDAAPVDEIVPMLFRMGRSGADIRTRLTNGGDLRNRRCRSALAIATDEPIPRAPPGRRVYVFDPRSWTADRLGAVRQEVAGWR